MPPLPTEFALVPHLAGYVFATLGPVIPLQRISVLLWQHLAFDGGAPIEKSAEGHLGSLPLVIGIVERFGYVAAPLLGFPEFIGVWLVLKVAGGWKGWEAGRDIPGAERKDGTAAKVDGRSLFNTTIIAAGLSLIWALAGIAIISWWQHGRGDLAMSAAAATALATLVYWLQLYLSLQAKNRARGAAQASHVEPHQRNRPVGTSHKGGPMNEALVQNRVTVLGLALSLLIFATGALIALANAEGTRDITWVYLNSFIPITIGFLTCLLGLFAFLTSQHSANPKWWFSVGQLLLYIGLAGFLASGGNNLLHGLTTSLRTNDRHSTLVAPALLILLRLVSEVAWLLLLFYAPISYLRSGKDDLLPERKRLLWLLYVLTVLLVFLPSASGYYLRNSGAGFRDFAKALLLQLVQPFTWTW